MQFFGVKGWRVPHSALVVLLGVVALPLAAQTYPDVSSRHVGVGKPTAAASFEGVLGAATFRLAPRDSWSSFALEGAETKAPQRALACTSPWVPTVTTPGPLRRSVWRVSAPCDGPSLTREVPPRSFKVGAIAGGLLAYLVLSQGGGDGGGGLLIVVPAAALVGGVLAWTIWR